VPLRRAGDGSERGDVDARSGDDGGTEVSGPPPASETAPIGLFHLTMVRGRTLAGDPVLLPRDLPAEHTLVVVAFRQRQQTGVDAWIDLAVELGVPASPEGAERPMRHAVVEVPVLSRRWMPARRAIDGGMATSIRDRAVLARTITVYASQTGFRRACAIPPRVELAAMLVDRRGTASFAVTGLPRDKDRRGLAAALRATGRG
jgi:hypothetical protein